MLDPDMLQLAAAGLAAAAVAAIALVLLSPLLAGQSQEDQRKRSVTETRAVKSATRMAHEATATRRKAVADSLKDIENRQKSSKKRPSLKVRLDRAGLKIAPRVFWMWSAVCGLALGAASFISLAGSPLVLVVTPLALFVGTFGLPRFWLNRRIRRRQFKFTTELANAVDLIVRGVKAGLPLNECLQIISRESPEPIASEFKEVVDQQRVGVTLADALERLSVRMPTAEVRFFAIVIAIQQQAGGNLSEALGNLSGVLRDRAKLALKVQAMSAEAKAGAMVLGSLPPLVCLAVSIMSPKYLTPLFYSTPGNFVLLCALCWMGLGVLTMKKMINFKF